MDTVSDIEQRITAKQTDIEAAAAKLADVTGRLIDATDGQRAKLLQERMLIVSDRDALHDEVAELKQRYWLAAIEPYEAAEAEAIAAAIAADERLRAAGKALNTAIDEQRRFVNGGRGRLAKEKGQTAADLAYADFEARLARLKADAQIASDAARHAASARDRAHNETAAMRKHLGMG